MKFIWITSVVLGYSDCSGASCCIKDNDCTHNANENHRTDVYRACDNKRSCTVRILQEEISCGYRDASNNDFERITYTCIDDSQKSSTKDSYLFLDGTTTKPDFQTEESSDRNISEHDENASHEDRVYNSFILPVAMATVCLFILISIAVVTVMMRRKRWTKVRASVEMTDNDSSDRNQTVDTNENQTMSLNNGSRSPIYSNDKLKECRDKGAKSSETYEVPSNAVYSLADDAGSRPTEDPNVYCDVESREPAHQEPRPRSNVYSVARDVGEPECAGSTADASNEDDSVYCDVRTTKITKVASNSAQNAWKESEYKAVNADKTHHTAQEKKTDSPGQKTAQDSYTNVNKPSKKVAASESKAGAPGKVEAKEKVNIGHGFPIPIYETMSHVVPESIYANVTVPLPSWSVASRVLSTVGSEMENPYCEMRSLPMKVKDNGSKTVVETGEQPQPTN